MELGFKVELAAMKIVWATDLHLAFAGLQAIEQWYDSIRELHADRLLITGDISESTDLLFQLDRMLQSLQIPIDFVLGNHDYYQSSIRETRTRVRQHCRASGMFHYLTGATPIELDFGWSLVGHDGWGDATLGNIDSTPIRLADFESIRDFHGLSFAVRQERLRELGRDAAETLKLSLQAVLRDGRHAMVLTHVPPFAEAMWYEGGHSDPDWLPYFACGAVGTILEELAEQYPHKKIFVLCGHTHHPGSVWMRPNLCVVTGGAEYGKPQTAGIWDTAYLEQSFPSPLP